MSLISPSPLKAMLLSCIALQTLVVPAWAAATQEPTASEAGIENGHSENGHAAKAENGHSENGHAAKAENGHSENGHAAQAESAVAPSAVPADAAPNATQPAFDEAELFLKTFGKKATVSAQPRKLTIPVTLDGHSVGTIAALLSMDGSGQARFEWVGLKAALTHVMRSEYVDALASRVDQLGYVSTKDFADLGWTISFDQTQVAAKITADSSFRKTQEGSLRSRRPTPYGQRIEPAAVSAIVNVNAAQDFRTGLASNNGRQPIALNFSGAANVKSLVVEGGANYQESKRRRWVRNDTRLVKDWQEKAVRFSVGDLSYNTGALQSAPSLGGLSASRNFNLRPYDVVQSSGAASFVLETESRVEFYVNGQFIQSKDLPAGPHRLSDFPVSTGANDITLRIKDKFGQVKEVTIPFFYSSALLSEGIHDFSYNVGYLTENRQGVHHYDTKVPVYSVMHRYGLTSEATMGLNAQGSKKQTQVGAEAQVATILGNFQVRGAASQVKAQKDETTLVITPSARGYATTVQYDLLAGKDEYSRALTLQWARYTAHFSSLGQLKPLNPLAHRFTGRYSQEIYAGLYGALSGSYGLRQGTAKRENSQTLALNKSLDHGVTLTMDLTRTKQPATKLDERLMVGVRWSIPNTLHTITADYQTQHHAKRVRWNYGSTNGVGSFASTAALQHQEKNKGGDASLTYTANRAQATVAYERNDPNNGPNSDRTSLIVSSAVVFADGHAAISRPVHDSFVIVSPHAALSKEKVCVNPTSDRCAAQNDFLGSAVVPDVLAYNISTVSIDGSELPVGQELGSNTYYVESTYKRGAVVKVGTDATVMVKGQLLDAAGKPIALASAQVTSVDEPDREPVLFFTNRNGYFAAEGLKPGHYKITVYGETMYELDVIIPEGTTGLFDLKAQNLKPSDEHMKLIQEGGI